MPMWRVLNLELFRPVVPRPVFANARHFPFWHVFCSWFWFYCIDAIRFTHRPFFYLALTCGISIPGLLITLLLPRAARISFGSLLLGDSPWRFQCALRDRRSLSVSGFFVEGAVPSLFFFPFLVRTLTYTRSVIGGVLLNFFLATNGLVELRVCTSFFKCGLFFGPASIGNNMFSILGAFFFLSFFPPVPFDSDYALN